MKKEVVAYKRMPAFLLDKLRSEFEVTSFDDVTDGNREAVRAALRTAHGLIGASVRIDASMLQDSENLETISTISVGYDQFDVPYLTGRRILLTHTPGVLTETTADTVFTLVLATARRIVELAEFVKAGHWTRSIDEAQYGTDVHGKTIGFIGMGRIGTAVAYRAHLGFHMRVLYHDLSVSADVEKVCAAMKLPMDEVLRQADFVVIVLPLLPETEKLIGAREFALMKPSAIFINGSRGKIVDQAALIDALRAGRIHAAGLDVFEKEPLPSDSPLLGMSNVVALPHIGSATHETRLAMAALAVDNLATALHGDRPAASVNPQAWSRGP